MKLFFPQELIVNFTDSCTILKIIGVCFPINSTFNSMCYLQFVKLLAISDGKLFVFQCSIFLQNILKTRKHLSLFTVYLLKGRVTRQIFLLALLECTLPVPDFIIYENNRKRNLGNGYFSTFISNCESRNTCSGAPETIVTCYSMSSPSYKPVERNIPSGFISVFLRLQERGPRSRWQPRTPRPRTS